jgi:hypothetical protein
VIALLSSAVHSARGDAGRTAFTAGVSLPILMTLLVQRGSGRVQIALH